MTKDSSARCYQKTKKKIKKKSSERYQNLSEEKKKQEYGRKRYKNPSKHEKQKLFEYRKRYYKMRKSASL